MTSFTGWITGGCVAVLGILGLALSAHAIDLGMSIFGLGMFAFAVLFDFWIIKLVFDENDARLFASSQRPEGVNRAPVPGDVDAAADPNVLVA